MTTSVVRTGPHPLRAPVVTLVALGAGAALLALRSPHEGGSYGMCPVLALTGLFCAGCGVLRASHDLARLDIAGAWAMNPLWVILVPLIVLGLTRWTWLRWQDARALKGRRQPRETKVPSSVWAAGGVVVIIVYSVARNFPALGPWLVPGGVA